MVLRYRYCALELWENWGSWGVLRVWPLENDANVLGIPVGKKSQNPPRSGRNVHTYADFIQHGTLWDICLMRYGICEMGMIGPHICRKNSQEYVAMYGTCQK